MSVCNIFKEIDSNNNGQGVFLTFSQYTEDLTREISEGMNHRVVPSKFLCLNIDNPSVSFNSEVPERLQNEYENRLTFLRENTLDWNPLYSRYTLFRTLQNLGILNITQGNDYFNEIVCGGDINVISNKNADGTNYSEIYCLVEPSASKIQFVNGKNTLSDYTVDVSSISADWISVIKGWWSDNTGAYPEYPANLTGLTSTPNFDDNVQYLYHSNDNAYQNGDVAPEALNSTNIFDDVAVYRKTQDSSFAFNCIIVFYDVYENGVLNKNYKSLPLGIWFSGPLDNNGDLMNTVTKFVRSETIFGQGTSYGLRICLKNVSSPFGSPVALEANDHFCELVTPISELCDQFAQAAIEMQKVAESSSLSLVAMKDWAAIFMNSRINVPYIREIGGVRYWFVNGRNVGEVGNAQPITPSQSVEINFNSTLGVVDIEETQDVQLNQIYE